MFKNEFESTGIERLPGEPFSKFSRRLEDHMRPEILKAFQEEIVDKPPVITVIPKNKLRIISSPKKKHSNKSQLSLADKRIVEKERKRIIELYRSKKSNKLNKLD
ncbi:2659_t:CDS:2 [Entrophospora sp. SA101]|nr:2659_t:CDS:2 [Entrophospora sp. SA101]